MVIRLTPLGDDKLDDNLKHLLIEGEEIIKGYKTIRDIIAFTNKRVISVDKKGIVGKKKVYLSLPYKAVAKFSIETAGILSSTSELILISAEDNVLFHLSFEDKGLLDIQKYIAKEVL